MSYPQCTFCKWYKGVGCKAYPKGIPDEIYFNKVDHRSPYKNDNDIQFKEK